MSQLLLHALVVKCRTSAARPDPGQTPCTEDGRPSAHSWPSPCLSDASQADGSLSLCRVLSRLRLRPGGQGAASLGHRGTGAGA